jgi:hypothetical protein
MKQIYKIYKEVNCSMPFQPNGPRFDAGLDVLTSSPEQKPNSITEACAGQRPAPIAANPMLVAGV